MSNVNHIHVHHVYHFHHVQLSSGQYPLYPPCPPCLPGEVEWFFGAKGREEGTLRGPRWPRKTFFFQKQHFYFISEVCCIVAKDCCRKKMFCANFFQVLIRILWNPFKVTTSTSTTIISVGNSNISNLTRLGMSVRWNSVKANENIKARMLKSRHAHLSCKVCFFPSQNLTWFFVGDCPFIN